MEEKVVNVKPGLEGVVADTTTISKVMPEINSLVYRGYPVQDLAETCNFEEVAYLLWNGELPTMAKLNAFVAKERSMRSISDDLKAVIKKFPKNAHPMDTIRTGVSFLGMEDERVWNNDPETNMDKSIRLMAAIPTIIAADYRARNEKDIIDARDDLSFSENFFYMCFGEIPKQEIVKAFDVSLILYAEHGFNASTFTGRVITSTTSDIYSAVCGAIGALKGPLHGGANEQVMHVLKEIDDPAIAKKWMLKALEDKRKVMGFGHRVYRKGDSRVPTMKKYANLLADLLGETKWRDISQVLEDTMVEKKGIHPNLDFPAGPAYYLMGFDIDMFTPIFVMARITGWTAHIMEQTAHNRIIRPLCQYIGPGERKIIPLAERA
ncbi:MAG: bifunctional 2-methylcitrate synthase/citrate synthase [Epsilonproteobacteria bacterium]|nr:MAG: bifunctional 2-methylcitrate synthase/citrate synthase [Campylobacterota bacterium]RLA68131.1 MAG: bifunctional 2-methylcitrate synthase/citrate synthase [Campylobacterota bacterium]